MPEDLPIYSEPPLRTSLQFASLDKLKGVETATIWEKSDSYIAGLEDAVDVSLARTEFHECTKESLLNLHGVLFSRREGSGELRHTAIQPVFRGQDCPEPQFVSRSLDNFSNWLTAESVSEIHPIEKAALALTRIIDIWPFEYGNVTVAIMSGNLFLRHAGLAPFFVLPKDAKEFKKILAQAVSIETQPLVNAILSTVKREMEAIAPR